MIYLRNSGSVMLALSRSLGQVRELIDLPPGQNRPDEEAAHGLLQAHRRSWLESHSQAQQPHVRGVRPLDPVAEPDRALDIVVSTGAPLLLVPHPRLHDVDAEVLVVETVEIVTESQSHVLMEMVVQAGQKLVPAVCHVGIVGGRSSYGVAARPDQA